MNLKKYYLPIALVGLALTFSAMLSKADPLDVGAASVVSLGRNGTSTYLLYPTDTLSAANYNATSTTATSTFANGINLTGGCFAIGDTCLTASGITRTVTVTSANVTAGDAADTDYVYYVAGAHTVSLPAAAGNTNRYTVKNGHSAGITIDTVGAETIDGTASITLSPEDSVDIISNGTNFIII